MWKGYTLLVALVILIAGVTVYALDTIRSTPGKPVDPRVLALSIQNRYNTDMEVKHVPSRAVRIVCRPTADRELYHCRALTLDPAGVKCVLLVVDAGPSQYEVKAASFDPFCPEGQKA